MLAQDNLLAYCGITDKDTQLINDATMHLETHGANNPEFISMVDQLAEIELPEVLYISMTTDDISDIEPEDYGGWSRVSGRHLKELVFGKLWYFL